MLKKPPLFIYLDIISLPGKFMSKKNNALWHLNHVCPKCPEYRREFCYVDGKCYWNEMWKKGDYSISRDFGLINWVRTYLGKKTDLSKIIKK
jgi:hypothetical protein